MGQPAQIKPYSLSELANLYEISRETMRKWLSKVKDLTEREGYIFNIDQVQKIFNHLGTPTKD